MSFGGTRQRQALNSQSGSILTNTEQNKGSTRSSCRLRGGEDTEEEQSKKQGYMS